MGEGDSGDADGEHGGEPLVEEEPGGGSGAVSGGEGVEGGFFGGLEEEAGDEADEAADETILSHLLCRSSPNHTQSNHEQLLPLTQQIFQPHRLTKFPE